MEDALSREAVCFCFLQADTEMQFTVAVRSKAPIQTLASWIRIPPEAYMSLCARDVCLSSGLAKS
jgi:hypothetical protein